MADYTPEEGYRIIMARHDIFEAIERERDRQHDRWDALHDHGQGDCSSPNVADPVKVMVLTEEVGEVARAVLEGDTDGLQAELTQLAACCVAWLELLGVAE